MDRGQRKGGTETHCGDTHEDNQDVGGSVGSQEKRKRQTGKKSKDPVIFPSVIDISGILLKSLPILGSV